MIESAPYRKQVALLVRVLPIIAQENGFALKGGTGMPHQPRSPMSEIIDPKLRNIRHEFEHGFAGMTFEKVTCEELERTREDLDARIQSSFTDDDKELLLYRLWKAADGQALALLFASFDRREFIGITNSASTNNCCITYRKMSTLVLARLMTPVVVLPSTFSSGVL